MASTRYGRIQHDRHSAINVRFLSPDVRQEFADKFDEFHAAHDHDGEIPTFEMITAADTKGYDGRRTPVDQKYISIDGYSYKEITEYHEENGLYTSVFYEPPTCCIAPIIVVNDAFTDSGTLERHELSAVFGDMPEDDYASLLESVQKDGFMDPKIKLLDGKVLDGWHRYRAGKELNLLRKLKFQEWDEKNNGADAQAFVLARNIERRHLNASQRAQIVVAFNERFDRGNIEAQRSVGLYDDSGSPNGEPKTREELAKEAGVGTSTIDRAVAVEKAGESEKVIAGEKSASEVLKVREVSKLLKQKKRVLKNIWDTRIQAARDYTGDGNTDLNQHLTLPELEKGFAKNNESYKDNFESGMKRIDAAASFKNFQDRALDVDEFGNAKVDIEDLEAEYKAIMTYVGDICQWKRPDWSPDTNWILPLIAAKKAKASEDTADPKPDDLKTLREQVKAEMPKWKQRYKESGKKESELVSSASFSALIHVYRNWEEASGTVTEESAATVEELKELLKLLKSDSYVFIYRLRDYLRGTETVESPPETPADEANRPATELPLENTMDEMESIQKFDAKLKGFGVHEELVCDTLHFYYGIERADLSETPQETLIEISTFIEGFIDEPLEEWPEWIRNQVPKRELVLVSIGISRDDDEFELVEFSDEASDELDCELDELPQELKDALFKLAVKKIVEKE